MSSPTIVSGTMHSSGNFITVVFSEGVYTTSAHTTPIAAADFTLTLGGTGRNATAVAIHSIYKNDGTVLATTGGEDTVRMALTWTGIPNGNETVTVTVASGSAVYNVTAEAMAAGQTTGALSLSGAMAFTRTLYVSLTGVNTNDGLTPTSAKLTLAGAKTSLATGENKVIMKVGDHSGDTATWDTANAYVTLYGDYDGAIFGGGSGTIIIIVDSDVAKLTYVRQVDRIILKMRNNTALLDGASGGTQNQTFNYCTIRPGTGAKFLGQSSICYHQKATFNYCTQDTNDIGIAAYRYPTNTTVLEFNNYDSITAATNVTLTYLPVGQRITFNNSTIRYNNLIATMPPSTIHFISCTLKQASSSAYLLQSGYVIQAPVNDTPLVQAYCGFILMKDCTLQTDTGTALNLNSDYVNPDNSIYRIQTTLFNTLQLYCQMNMSRLLIDNANSNDKRMLLMRGTTLDGDTETYNSKDVLYYYGTTGTTTDTDNSVHMIGLVGLAASTSYTISFSYKKAANSSSADYDMRFGVLKGSQYPKDDLFTTPANALTYADYTSATHTYNTWYDKTLVFTTSSNANEEHFMVFYDKHHLYQFKITKPSIAAT